MAGIKALCILLAFALSGCFGGSEATPTAESQLTPTIDDAPTSAIPSDPGEHAPEAPPTPEDGDRGHLPSKPERRPTISSRDRPTLSPGAWWTFEDGAGRARTLEVVESFQDTAILAVHDGPGPIPASATPRLMGLDLARFEQLPVWNLDAPELIGATRVDYGDTWASVHAEAEARLPLLWFPLDEGSQRIQAHDSVSNANFIFYIEDDVKSNSKVTLTVGAPEWQWDGQTWRDVVPVQGSYAGKSEGTTYILFFPISNDAEWNLGGRSVDYSPAHGMPVRIAFEDWANEKEWRWMMTNKDAMAAKMVDYGIRDNPRDATDILLQQLQTALETPDDLGLKATTTTYDEAGQRTVKLQNASPWAVELQLYDADGVRLATQSKPQGDAWNVNVPGLYYAAAVRHGIDGIHDAQMTPYSLGTKASFNDTCGRAIDFAIGKLKCTLWSGPVPTNAELALAMNATGDRLPELVTGASTIRAIGSDGTVLSETAGPSSTPLRFRNLGPGDEIRLEIETATTESYEGTATVTFPDAPASPWP